MKSRSAFNAFLAGVISAAVIVIVCIVFVTTL